MSNERKFVGGINPIPQSSFPSGVSEGTIITHDGSTLPRGAYQYLNGLWVSLTSSIPYIGTTQRTLTGASEVMVSSDTIVLLNGTATFELLDSNDALVKGRTIDVYCKNNAVIKVVPGATSQAGSTVATNTLDVKAGIYNYLTDSEGTSRITLQSRPRTIGDSVYEWYVLSDNQSYFVYSRLRGQHSNFGSTGTLRIELNDEILDGGSSRIGEFLPTQVIIRTWGSSGGAITANLYLSDGSVLATDTSNLFAEIDVLYKQNDGGSGDTLDYIEIVHGSGGLTYYSIEVRRGEDFLTVGPNDKDLNVPSFFIGAVTQV